MEDYKDIDYGWLDDAIDLASFKYYVFVQSNKFIKEDGSEGSILTRYIVNGSLQAYKRRRTYSEDGSKPNISGREGKFYAKHDVILNEGDLIQRIDNGLTYMITQVNDYDYVGVRNYEVLRLGLDETRKYDFANFIEATFEVDNDEDDW